MDVHRMNGFWSSIRAGGHRMYRSAHLFILCPENTGFGRETGHRMAAEAVSSILWHKNESGAVRKAGGGGKKD